MIIVTGASRGLGQAITERLIEIGEEVIGLARNTSGLKINAIECDVSDYASVKNASKEVKRMKKPVKAFINAAGVASMNMAVTTDESTVQKLIQTNLVGTIYCCQLFAPIMLRQKQGSFINFSTIAVALALKGESVYAASKAGVESFSRTFAREMADLVVFFIDIPRKGKLDLDKIWTPSIEHLDILVKKLGVPIAVGATFPEGIEPDLRLMLIKKGIAPLLGLSDVLSALNASIIWKVQSEKLLKNKFQKLLSISENSSFQNVINNEAVSKDTLKTFGFRFPKYKKLNLKGLQRINEKLDCPMVLKICSDEVPHKQLMGGVKTNLLTKNRILNAAKLIAKNYEKKFRKEFSGYFLLEENINYNSDEYIIGAKKDPIMGITIIFGRGGTNVESKKDFKALLCPINSNELKLTLEYFGLTVEMNAFKELKQLILAVQKYVRKNIETFETLDLNPVVIDNNHRAVALDALLTTARI